MRVVGETRRRGRIRTKLTTTTSFPSFPPLPAPLPGALDLSQDPCISSPSLPLLATGAPSKAATTFSSFLNPSLTHPPFLPSSLRSSPAVATCSVALSSRSALANSILATYPLFKKEGAARSSDHLASQSSSTDLSFLLCSFAGLTLPASFPRGKVPWIYSDAI